MRPSSAVTSVAARGGGGVVVRSLLGCDGKGLTELADSDDVFEGDLGLSGKDPVARHLPKVALDHHPDTFVVKPGSLRPDLRGCHGLLGLPLAAESRESSLQREVDVLPWDQPASLRQGIHSGLFGDHDVTHATLRS
jgi:hypothetical protein